MIYEFIINYPNSNDCKCYDNWTGRCVITHMMVDTTPYGCFYNIFDLDFINCWDMYAIDEEAEFSISYDDGSLL